MSAKSDLSVARARNKDLTNSLEETGRKLFSAQQVIAHLKKKCDRLSQPFPSSRWIEPDREKHAWFEDGSRYLCAIKVCKTGPDGDIISFHWDFKIIVAVADETLNFRYEEGEYFTEWEFYDFNYFMVLDGEEPGPRDR